MLPVSIIVGEPVRRISRIGDFEVIGIVIGTMAGAALAVGDEGEGTGVVDLDPGCTGLGEEVRRDAADAGLDILKLSLWNEPFRSVGPDVVVIWVTTVDGAFTDVVGVVALETPELPLETIYLLPNFESNASCRRLISVSLAPSCSLIFSN